MASIGYNTRFAIENAPGSGVFVELDEVYDVVPPNESIDQVDVTHFQSPGRTRQFIAGLTDGGTASVSMNLIPNGASDQRIEGLKLAGTVLAMRITFPNAVTVTFSASVQSYSKTLPVDDRMTATMEVKIASVPIMVAGTAPANLILPAVSGVLGVGKILTAWPGSWTQSGIYTYQWRRNGTNIPAALNETYTQVGGDSGNGIDVVVTATNAAGAASATSARTADVP